MSKNISEISVFLPCYNEEPNIEKTTNNVKKILLKVAKKWEIIIVNDGSKDNTLEVARKLEEKDKRIRVVNHKENMGYGAALQSGFYNSHFEWIATIDADGQFDFGEISKLFAKTKEAQVIIGYRIERKDSALRKINGAGWTLLANLLLGIGVRDVDCAFKLVKKEVIDAIPHLESMRGGMISPELLARAKKGGFKIAEVPVHHYPREGGKQTGANLKVIFKSFSDLFKLWTKLNF